MKTTMTSETEARTYRQSTALRFGGPMATGTTMATLAYATLVAVGTVLAFAGTMFVLAEFPTGTGPLLVLGTVALGATLAVVRPRVRALIRSEPHPRQGAQVSRR